MLFSIGIIFLLIAFCLDMEDDKRKFEKEDYFFSHDKDWLLRLAMCSPGICCLCLFQNPLTIILTPFLVGSIYWFLFDGIYNVYVLDKSFFKVYGTTSRLDKFQQKIGWVASLILKILLITIFSYLLNIMNYGT
jgi:hypothetical protein